MRAKYKDDLIMMYDEAMKLSGSFNKNTYEDAFKELFEQQKASLKEILLSIREAGEDEKEELLEELGKVVPGYVNEKLRTIPGKRKKEHAVIDYNLAFVSFFIPLILYSRDKEMEEMADSMIKNWNKMDAVTMKVGKATFEEINSGFRRRLCYVTTAVCRSLDKPDECYELRTLRDYRDHYLALSEGGKDTIREYYNIAPTIVKRIDRRKDSAAVYRNIWETYLCPCIMLIEDDKKEECRALYTKMVHDLENEYLFQ